VALALLLLFVAWALVLLIFRRQYARFLGVDPDRIGWRRAGYLWGYVIAPCIILAALVLLVIGESTNWS
jgi:hypothetical protein